MITKDAKTSEGIFKVHKIRERGTDTYYYEIPPSELGKDFLFVGQIAQNTIGAGYGGQTVNELVGRWERRENRVFLREITYDITADPGEPIAKAVQAANNPSIIMSFPDRGVRSERSAGDRRHAAVPERRAGDERARPRSRPWHGCQPQLHRESHCVSDQYRSRVHADLHFACRSAGSGGGRGGPQGGMRPGSGTVVVHFSMVKLPEKPMMPRLADARVGYFTTSTMDYSRPEHRAEPREFVARWRLEKKDPTAALYPSR